MATFDGIAYTGSLIKYGNPQHMLHVPKAIREEAGKGVGDVLEVVVWKDDEERTLEVPTALARVMKKEGLLAFFDSLSYTHRKDIAGGSVRRRRKRRARRGWTRRW